MDFFTKGQLEVLDQSIRKKRIRIEVENLQFKTIDTIEGLCSEGSINLDANSDNRRSCSLTLIVDDRYTDIVEKKYLPQKNGLIWLDKYIKIFIGIDNYMGETQWFNKGLFMIDTPTYNYSATTHNLSFSGMDIMSNFNDQRRGQLTNLSTVIEAYKTEQIIEGENTKEIIIRTTFREAFIAIIKDFTTIKNYYIAPMSDDIAYLPENINFNAGSTVYSMWVKLLEYLPGWEMFFDVNGVFTVQPIPNSKNDPLYYLNPENVNTETHTVDFNNVKNHIVVRGRTHDNDYFVTQENVGYKRFGEDTPAKYSLTLKIDNFKPSELTNNITIGFVWLDNLYNPEFQNVIISYVEDAVTKEVTYPLKDFESENVFSALLLQPNSLNTIRFRKLVDDNNNTQEYWDYLSSLQSEAYAVDENTESPYYINSELIGTNYYGGLTVCANHKDYTVLLNNKTAITGIDIGTQITFMPNILNVDSPTITLYDGKTKKRLEDYSLIPVVLYEGGVITPLGANKWDGDFTIYRVTYRIINNTKYFVYEGRHQTLTYYLSGGEYENIYSNSLAKQRADYELFLHSNLNDTLNLTIIPDYTLDVNVKINYTEKTTGINRDYIIKSISVPLDAKATYMNISAMVLY